MDLIMSALTLCAHFINYDPLNYAVTSTSGDIATPPVHFLWKNRLPRTKHTSYKTINHLIGISFSGLKP